MNSFTSQSIVKRWAEGITAVMTFPAWLLYRMEAAMIGKERAFMGASQRAALWSGTLGVYLRRALFKRILSRVGSELFISFGTLLSKPTIELGHRVYIGAYCLLGDVRIGDDTMLADQICIPSGSGQHGVSRLDIPMQSQIGEYRTVHIGKDCWIGSGAIVLADIGDHCIVGAGSVVTSPVEDYLIVVGNPAKPIKDRRFLSAPK